MLRDEFNGFMDEVAIFDQPLSQSAIDDLYQGDGPNRSYSDVVLDQSAVAYWRLNEQGRPQDNVAKDSSGNGNDGYLNSGMDLGFEGVSVADESIDGNRNVRDIGSVVDLVNDIVGPLGWDSLPEDLDNGLNSEWSNEDPDFESQDDDQSYSVADTFGDAILSFTLGSTAWGVTLNDAFEDGQRVLLVTDVALFGEDPTQIDNPYAFGPGTSIYAYALYQDLGDPQGLVLIAEELAVYGPNAQGDSYTLSDFDVVVAVKDFSYELPARYNDDPTDDDSPVSAVVAEAGVGELAEIDDRATLVDRVRNRFTSAALAVLNFFGKPSAEEDVDHEESRDEVGNDNWRWNNNLRNDKHDADETDNNQDDDGSNSDSGNTGEDFWDPNAELNDPNQIELPDNGEDVPQDPARSVAYEKKVLDKNPVGYWKLEAISGNTARDSSGNGNDGELLFGVKKDKPGVLEGTGDNAMDFDGHNDRILIDPDSSMANISKGGVAMWFNPDDLNGWQALFSADQSGQRDEGHLDIWLDGDDLRVRFQYKDNTVSRDSRELRIRNVIHKDQWQHLAVTWDNSRLRVYLNGEEVASDSASGWSFNQGNTPIVLGGSIRNDGGKDGNHVRSLFNGLLDEVAIFDGQLSEADVIELADLDVDDASEPNP